MNKVLVCPWIGSDQTGTIKPQIYILLAVQLVVEVELSISNCDFLSDPDPVIIK